MIIEIYSLVVVTLTLFAFLYTLYSDHKEHESVREAHREKLLTYRMVIDANNVRIAELEEALRSIRKQSTDVLPTEISFKTHKQGDR